MLPPLSIYFFVITLYNCQFKSAHPFFCVLIVCLANIRNCNDVTVLLYSGLNLLFNVVQRPIVLHFSCSVCVNVSKNCRTFLPIQFLAHCGMPKSLCNHELSVIVVVVISYTYTKSKKVPSLHVVALSYNFPSMKVHFCIY